MCTLAREDNIDLAECRKPPSAPRTPLAGSEAEMADRRRSANAGAVIDHAPASSTALLMGDRRNRCR